MFQKDEINFTLIIIVCSITFLVFIVSFFILFRGYYIRRLKFYKERQDLESNFKQQLLQTQIEIQEQTLKTISQEIHDNVGQVLSLAKLNLNTVGNITDQRLQSKIDSTKDLVSKAINDLRDLSRSLHGEKIGEIGLEEAIANELKVLQNTGQYKTGLQINGQVYKLDPQKEMVLFRIVQEALHNAVKHANAANLKVQMNYSPEIFALTISDDGVGFQPEQLPALQTGIGLKSMQNRAALIGGEFSIHSSKNNGTSISIAMPATFKPFNP
jgi:two-component system, NarL family, sensor kinase